MQVEISKVDNSPQGTRVAFVSEYGSASARWAGPAPKVGEKYDVELSAEAPLSWGHDISASPAGTAAHIEPRGDGVTLDGLLEAHDQGDDVATLRIGRSLLLVETRGPAPPDGTAVRAQIETLVLTDTGI